MKRVMDRLEGDPRFEKWWIRRMGAGNPYWRNFRLKREFRK